MLGFVESMCIWNDQLAEWFSCQYPNHFISPIPLWGSAVETLFSQFKYCIGGKLSSTNYAAARASLLIKHTVSSHHSSKGYRDTPLDLPDCVLQKKKYGKWTGYNNVTIYAVTHSSLQPVYITPIWHACTIQSQLHAVHWWWFLRFTWWPNKMSLRLSPFSVAAPCFDTADCL